jgi:hypothetical protein
MIKQIAGLVGTKDANDWETKFITGIVQLTDNGENTKYLSPPRVEVIERIYRRHFA